MRAYIGSEFPCDGSRGIVKLRHHLGEEKRERRDVARAMRIPDGVRHTVHPARGACANRDDEHT
eukprot:4011040-Prymnesium_polylepis.2